MGRIQQCFSFLLVLTETAQEAYGLHKVHHCIISSWRRWYFGSMKTGGVSLGSGASREHNLLKVNGNISTVVLALCFLPSLRCEPDSIHILNMCHIKIRRDLSQNSFWDSVSCNPSSPHIYYTAKRDLELLIFLLPFPECWDSRYTKLYQVNVGGWNRLYLLSHILSFFVEENISTLYSTPWF